jgi:excisionase family DNA binding protein
MAARSSKPVGRDQVPYGRRTPRFYSVAEAAELFGMSTVTLYRAIRDGEIPAVRIRGRVIVPAKAIDALADITVTSQSDLDSLAIRRLHGSA